MLSGDTVDSLQPSRGGSRVPVPPRRTDELSLPEWESRSHRPVDTNVWQHNKFRHFLLPSLPPVLLKARLFSASLPTARFRNLEYHFFMFHRINAGRAVVLYRVSRVECARLRENVPYVKVHRYNPKHLYPKLNGYGDNGERSLKV